MIKSFNNYVTICEGVISMNRNMKKTAAICTMGAMLLLSNLEYVAADNTSGTDGVAGIAVLMEQYQNSTVASKAKTEGVTTTSIEEVYEPIDGYENLALANVSDVLNIREVPVDGAIVGRLPADAACDIVSEENGWCYIKSGEIEGYVSAEYLLTGEEALKKAYDLVELVATVDADSLNLREEPNTECGIIEVLGNSQKLEVVEVLGDWVKVVVDSTEGYVAAEYITVSEELQTARTLTQMMYGMEVSDLRVQICEFAQQFVGNPYVYGGNSLTHGTDCSGFTNLIYAHFGISIPRTATTQYNFGTKISTAELRPGDLIIYGEYQIEHVALYLGNGQIVHASNERTGIRYSNMYYRNIIGCVRILND